MKVGILCSGVALGVYIPAVHIHRDLESKGVFSEVYVLENLIPDDKKGRINENKIAFHKDFSVARMGQRVAGDILPIIDRDKLAEIFKSWIDQEIEHFIIISGFWVSILEIFKSRYPGRHFVGECLHIDSDFSPSWKKAGLGAPYYHNRWLISHKEKKIVSELHITDLEPIPFYKRHNRFLTHGGGWGMGTYRSKLPELKKAGLDLDIMAYCLSEVPEHQENDRYFMIDPDWSPWLKSIKGKYVFPPFAQVAPDKKTIFRNKDDYPELFDITREALGVISKPGGSTLLDSLASATPLIMLEPFGTHEAKNAELWVDMGFGIYYEDWKKECFNPDILKKLHEELLSARGRKANYVDDFLENNKGVILCSQGQK